MSKPLLDVLFASEKRINVLMLLKDGPKGMEELLNLLDTSRQILLPQLKMLVNSHLIIHSKDTCRLSTIGKLLADKMLPVVKTTEMLDNDIDYWGTHRLDFIPPYLLNEIDRLRGSVVVDPPLAEVYDLSSEFSQCSKVSSSLFRASTFFHPMYPSLFSELLENGVEIYFIISQEVFANLCTHPDAGFEEIVQNDLFHLSVYPKKMDFLSFACNDHYTIMHLLRNDGGTDGKYVLCPGADAAEWGKELFECYLKNSSRVVRLPGQATLGMTLHTGIMEDQE